MRNATLRCYVEGRLVGNVAGPDGVPVEGPSVPWTGRRHGRRQDRRWATAWSPEQIARRLRFDFPDDETMRIGCEAIYQSLYVQGRDALRRALTACLRKGRALRVPRARVRGRGKSFVTPEILISQRPAEAADRAVPGHWEGDLILGLACSAIGTLVERTRPITMLLRLPRMEGYGCGPRVKNGPTLAGSYKGLEPCPLRRPLESAQYAAKTYREHLAKHGLAGSMRRRGNPYDNTKAESFMKTLKVEGVYPITFEMFADLLERLPHFIEETYNPQRIHSALGYLIPTASGSDSFFG